MAKKKSAGNVSHNRTIEICTDGETVMLRLVNADILEVEEGVLTPAAIMTFDQAMDLAESLYRLATGEHD